ncbi:MAG: hypothetical protein ACYS8W_03865 [Planctomycetota bacterium]|jgi:hypothetical protein
MELPPESAEEFKEKCLYYLWSFFEGVPVSFSLRPLAQGVTPEPGLCEIPYWNGPDYYNTLAVRTIYGETTTGRVMIDFTLLNERVENNSGLFEGEHYLGVFINQYAHYAVLACINGDREACAKWLAVVMAHEIAHSLGIIYHDDIFPNIMSSTLAMDSSTPAFTASQLEFMIEVMPGPWR